MAVVSLSRVEKDTLAPIMEEHLDLMREDGRDVDEFEKNLNLVKHEGEVKMNDEVENMIVNRIDSLDGHTTLAYDSDDVADREEKMDVLRGILDKA